MEIAIVDYGVGNLFSLACSARAVGAEARVASDPEEIKSADLLILPGVGAFEDAAGKLSASGMARAVKEHAAAGKPLLGICLGMQLLFEKSFEYGEHAGLGLVPGAVRPLSFAAEKGLKIPHMGWNSLEIKQKSPLFKYVKNGDFVYFVHSYHAECPLEYVTAVSDYGGEVTACVRRENVFGCQFHPEKSGGTGLGILRAFCEFEV